MIERVWLFINLRTLGLYKQHTFPSSYWKYLHLSFVDNYYYYYMTSAT